MKIRVVGAEFYLADRWRHLTKLMFPFHSSAEVPKNPLHLRQSEFKQHRNVTEWFSVPLGCRLLHSVEKCKQIPSELCKVKRLDGDRWSEVAGFIFWWFQDRSEVTYLAKVTWRQSHHNCEDTEPSQLWRHRAITIDTCVTFTVWLCHSLQTWFLSQVMLNSELDGLKCGKVIKRHFLLLLISRCRASWTLLVNLMWFWLCIVVNMWK